MSLYKRKDSSVWWVKLTLNGRRLQQSTGTSDRIKAQELHDKLKASLWDQERLGVKPSYTWKQAVVRYVDETKHKKSHDEDLAHLKWLDKHFGSLALGDVTRDQIDRVSAVRKAEGVANGSVNRVLAVIRAVLRRAAFQWEWIDRVPKVRLLPEPKLRVRYLTEEQAKRLLQELPPHLEAMARFSLLTGLRQGNVRDLAWPEVDLDGRKLWIRADQAKGGKAIAVPLSDATVQLLKRLEGNHEKAVFTYLGEPISQVGTRAWRSALTRAGIENFRWHDLRHTWASWHAQKGTPQAVLQELGGWESAPMVRRYAHFSAEHLRSHVDAFSGGLLQ